MGAIDERWEEFSDSDWSDFAEAWMLELRGFSSPEWHAFAKEWIESRLGISIDQEADVGQLVVEMNFTSTAKQQWTFLQAAVAYAESDDELGHIAAGPFEHLLGWHGDDYIDRVEGNANSDAKFGRMLTFAYRYKMSDAVWKRVQNLQERFADS